MAALERPLRDMLGDALADAVDAARLRLSDDTVMARCEAGLWFVERAGSPVAEGLTYEGAVTATEALA
jgi:hypothetical protein